MPMREIIYDRLRVLANPSVRRWVKNQPWFIPVSRRLFGNNVYSDSYNADIERIEKESVEQIAEWIADELAPGRAIDIGCGPGHLMAALHQRGVEVFGVDIADAALRRVAQKGLSAQRFDLTVPDQRLPGIPYDLAISCEVAEHLDPQHAGRFIEHLTSAAPRVYLTAAEPNKQIGPGLYHVNEQPNEYWMRLFDQRGFVLDVALTRSARSALAAAGDRVIEYLRRPMVFTRSEVVA